MMVVIGENILLLSTFLMISRPIMLFHLKKAHLICSPVEKKQMKNKNIEI